MSIENEVPAVTEAVAAAPAVATEKPANGRFKRGARKNADAQKEDNGNEVVLAVNRCTKVVKGGKNMSFGALVIVGDGKGRVGYGYGKANEVADAIRKGGDAARKNMVEIPKHGTTIPHTVSVKFRGSKILLRPASEGTGLIAGGTMRAILSLGGVGDVLAKSLGASNPMNVVKATFQAISMMSLKEQIMEKRGKI